MKILNIFLIQKFSYLFTLLFSYPDALLNLDVKYKHDILIKNVLLFFFFIIVRQALRQPEHL